MSGRVLIVGGFLAGGLIAGGVALATLVSATSLGSISLPSPAPAAAATASPAISPSLQIALEQAAATCPGLDWALLGGGVLVDPALSAGLTSEATDLCSSPDRTATLVALLPGPTEGIAAAVLAHSLDADPDLTAPAADAIAFAAVNLGAPYRWGGTGPGGFDCSGLTMEAYKAAGVSLPRVAQDQFDAGPAVGPGVPLMPGDLVFFGAGAQEVSHVGLYIGGGDMIDAPHSGAFVRIEPTPTTPGASFGSDIYVGATAPS